MMLSVCWRPSLTPADLAPEAYADLLARLPQATPFNRLAWLQGAAAALPAGADLQVLQVWRAERLLACLPLVRQRERRLGLGWTTLRHLGYPLGDRLALALDPAQPELAERVYQEIADRLPHALLELDELTEQDQWILERWRPLAAQARLRVNCRVPCHQIEPADAEEPAAPLRHELRRARRRCAEREAVVQRLAPTAEDWPSLAVRLQALEALSWKGSEGVGIFSGARRQRWMQVALQGLAAEDGLRIVLLEHQGVCLSYRLGLLQGGRLYDYNIAFHPDHAALGSGRLLLDEWLRWGLEAGWEWIDASRVSLHNSSHQLHERQTDSLTHWRWSLYSRSPQGRLLALLAGAWQLFKQGRERLRSRKAPGA
ncbi:GNAT family N-acetyltransferase [Pseudomonas oryzihabitans]|uniref:GNAT family N-acetyltransferase n=1 Tax=Pseudomonas oryzihabitans TaxID=47885 RepID=UPI003D03B0C6